MSGIYFPWCEGTQDALAPQLVNIGNNLSASENKYGLSDADIAYWKFGAQVNDWLQTRAIVLARGASTGLTASRDELQLDKTVEDFVFPTFELPPPPVAPQGVKLKTDFLDWCNDRYGIMRRNGLTDAQAKLLGFLVPDTTPIPPHLLKPRVTSIDTQSSGKVAVSTTRDGQKMVHVRLRLDTGQVLEKTLANTHFVFDLPTDRPHAFEADCIYTDKNGDFIGQWSDVKSDVSEL